MANANSMPRTLGWFEDYCHTVPNCNVIIASHVKGHLMDATLFEKAVKATAARHPQLRSIIVDSVVDSGANAAKNTEAKNTEGKEHKGLKEHKGKEHSGAITTNTKVKESKKAFVELDGFVPDKEHFEIIDAKSEDEWRIIAERESNLAADMYGKSPLWKIILVRYGAASDSSEVNVNAASSEVNNEDQVNVLLVKFHHCMGDGSSGYIITHDILRFYQRLDEHGDIPGEMIQPLPRLESPDKMAFPTGIGAEELPAVNDLMEKFTKRRCEFSPSPALPFDRKVGGEHNSTLYRDGSQESADALLTLCREKGLTMGAVFVAATYFAIARMDETFCSNAKIDPKTKFTFDFDMDVNLRNRLQNILGNDHVGAIIGMMSFSLSLSGETNFWAFAAEVKKAMADFLEKKYHLYYFDVNKRFDALVDADSCDSETMPTDSFETKYNATALKFQENLRRNDGLIQDMNFSSFGKYFYDSNYGLSTERPLTIDKMYATGGGWCPTFGSCVFLILGINKRNFYTFVYATSEENSRVAADFFNSVVDIIEMAHELDENYCLLDWVSSPSHPKALKL